MSRGASGVHALVGGKAYDWYLAEEALERLLTAAVGADRADSVSVLRGEETSWARVLDAARTGSLFAQQRVVVVRNAEALKGEAQGLPAYLDDPTPGVALILMAAKVDRRRSVWKLLLERARVETIEPLKEPALRRRLALELRQRRLELGPDGIEEIVSRVGQDLRRVIGELDKLEAFAQGRGGLTAEDVAACLGRGIAQPLYKLSDAFVARRPTDVLARMEEVLDEGEAPVLVLGTIYRALRTLRGAAELTGAPWGEVASRVGVPPFKVRDLMEAARRWPEADLRRGLAALGEADRRLKSGCDPRVALTAAVAAISGEARPSSRPAR